MFLNDDRKEVQSIIHLPLATHLHVYRHLVHVDMHPARYSTYGTVTARKSE